MPPLYSRYFFCASVALARYTPVPTSRVTARRAKGDLSMADSQRTNAEYILSMCEELSALAKCSNFEVTAHILEMAALQIVLEVQLSPKAQAH
jgi:hypothetical protein